MRLKPPGVLGIATVMLACLAGCVKSLPAAPSELLTGIVVYHAGAVTCGDVHDGDVSARAETARKGTEWRHHPDDDRDARRSTTVTGRSRCRFGCRRSSTTGCMSARHASASASPKRCAAWCRTPTATRIVDAAAVTE